MASLNGLHVALSGLRAAQRGLDVTGHNIANANTEGYSRQRVSQVADSGPLVAAIHARWPGGGLGVKSGTIERLRDEFLQLRSQQEHGTEADLRQQQVTLGRIESLFNEPSDTGLAAQLADFWAGWDDLANRPEDVAARAQLLERAQTLANGFNGARERLTTQRTSMVEELGSTITEVNALAARVAEINGRILTATRAGLSPNDLMDQRDLMISQLADRVGATARRGDEGLFDVYVGGTAIVRGSRAEELEVNTTVSGGDTTYSVVWSKDGLPTDVGGLVGGQISSIEDLMPRYDAGLSTIVDELVSTVNGVHLTAQALDGSTGRDFFLVDAGGRLQVNPDLLADSSLVAAADAGAGTFDGGAAARLAASTAPDALYRTLVVQLGVEARTVNQRVDIQSAISEQVDLSLEATAGVNLDEEMVAMVAFQHAYNAAARVMTAVDETLSTLIERTGVVGR